MKYKKILSILLISILFVLIGTIKVQAASSSISATNETVEVGESVTITVKFTAAAWNIKVSGNGITGGSYASQTDDLSEQENVKNFSLDTSQSGTYTITMSGDITDADGKTISVDKYCTVTVNEKEEEPTTPTTTTTPTTPTTPTVEEPNFTETNKTMYAKSSMNLRSSWSTDSSSTGISKGTELTVTATSTNKVNGYIWYRVSYNGKTLYAASNLLTETKPEETSEDNEEEPTQITNYEDQEDPAAISDETSDEATELAEGLKTLQIEGLTLTPEFQPDIYEYTTLLTTDLSTLNIDAVAANSDWEVVLAGNDDIQEGENLIAINVYDSENEVIATYQIKVYKNTLDLTQTDKILQDGNRAATMKLYAVITLFIIALIILVAILIIKHRQAREEYDEEYEEDDDEFPEYDQNEDFYNNQEEPNENQPEYANDDKQEEPNNTIENGKKKGKHF